MLLSYLGIHKLIKYNVIAMFINSVRTRNNKDISGFQKMSGGYMDNVLKISDCSQKKWIITDFKHFYILLPSVPQFIYITVQLNFWLSFLENIAGKFPLLFIKLFKNNYTSEKDSEKKKSTTWTIYEYRQ